LKTGCAYESRQLEDYESLANALAVFALGLTVELELGRVVHDQAQWNFLRALERRCDVRR